MRWFRSSPGYSVGFPRNKNIMNFNQTEINIISKIISLFISNKRTDFIKIISKYKLFNFKYSIDFDDYSIKFIPSKHVVISIDFYFDKVHILKLKTINNKDKIILKTIKLSDIIN